jgi:hypothetical protein
MKIKNEIKMQNVMMTTQERKKKKGRRGGGQGGTRSHENLWQIDSDRRILMSALNREMR